MKKQIDMEKITKRNLRKMGDDAGVFAKRGEKELSRIAKIGKAEINIVGLNIKKNQLYYELGKKVYGLNARGKLNTKTLKKLCDTIGRIEKDLKARKRSVAKYAKKR